MCAFWSQQATLNLTLKNLTFKVPIRTAADNIQIIFSLFLRENKTYVSSESSARRRIDIKNQALFSLIYKSKK